ncbi:MAG: hypothetical protein FWD58_10905 [Firmicutes bacterium]|nr:hypothetical protein [Bacillota bacterium]
MEIKRKKHIWLWIFIVLTLAGGKTVFAAFSIMNGGSGVHPHIPNVPPEFWVWMHIFLGFPMTAFGIYATAVCIIGLPVYRISREKKVIKGVGAIDAKKMPDGITVQAFESKLIKAGYTADSNPGVYYKRNKNYTGVFVLGDEPNAQKAHELLQKESENTKAVLVEISFSDGSGPARLPSATLSPTIENGTYRCRIAADPAQKLLFCDTSIFAGPFITLRGLRARRMVKELL